MPKELNQIKDKVMTEIRQNKLKMKPRAYFVIGSLLTLTGLMFSIATSVFFLGLTRFAFRGRGFIGRYRLDIWLDNFPWWAPVLGILGLAAGIYILKKYDFSYRKNFLHIVILFVISVLLAGWIIDLTGLNDALVRHGPMQGIMHQYIQDSADINKRH